MRMRLRNTSVTRKALAVALGLVMAVWMTASAFAQTKAGAMRPAAKLQGTIRISGAWALYPMMVRWAEEFKKLNPDVRIDVSAGGAGKGIADTVAGMVDLGMVSRDIKPEEIKQGVVFVPVVKDAVFPAVNAANPVAKALLKKGIKKETFVDLWIQNKKMSWGAIAGMSVAETVQVYTRSDACGAAETWAKYLNNKKQEDLQGIGVYGDPGLADAVKKDKWGIGFNNLNYAYDGKTGLPMAGIQIVPIDVNGNGKIDPKEDISTKAKAIKSILDGVYPSPPARDLFVVTRNEFKEPAKSFVKWILTDGQTYANEVGYIAIKEAQVKEALAKTK